MLPDVDENPAPQGHLLHNEPTEPHEFESLYPRQGNRPYNPHLVAKATARQGTCTPANQMYEAGGNSPECQKCVQLRRSYEQAIAARLQAEAEFLAALHAHDTAATEHAVATIESVVAWWIESNRALRAHNRQH